MLKCRMLTGKTIANGIVINKHPLQKSTPETLQKQKKYPVIELASSSCFTLCARYIRKFAGFNRVQRTQIIPSEVKEQNSTSKYQILRSNNLPILEELH